MDLKTMAQVVNQGNGCDLHDNNHEIWSLLMGRLCRLCINICRLDTGTLTKVYVMGYINSVAFRQRVFERAGYCPIDWRKLHEAYTMSTAT